MKRLLKLLAAVWLLLTAAIGAGATALDLKGFAEQSGAITILETGNVIDPYFTLQALLLAHENGMDVSAYAEKWGDWLIIRQRPDGSFDRFCRAGPVWLGCRAADADDALLAIWLKFIDAMPTRLRDKPSWRKSRDAAAATLARLHDPTRGIYLVSPVFQHGLFMDNLEIWSFKSSRPGLAQSLEARDFARAIRATFWDAKSQRFLVSTQPEQRNMPAAFYPDQVAQIFPLLFDFTLPPDAGRNYYRNWMRSHRGAWLRQVRADYAWGLLALLAWKQHDIESAQCWMRETLPYQQTGHWTVTDEVVTQILRSKGMAPAPASTICR
jgi:hypothetical protein